MSFVIVSCLFDIGTFESNTKRRSVDDYIVLFEWLRSSNFPLILFTDVADKIKPREHLHLVRKTIPELKYYPKISGNPQVRGNLHNNKDTFTYYSVVNSKIDLLKLASEYAPQYDYYVWIDSGYSHVTIIPHDELERGIRHNMNGRIVMPLINYNPKDDIKQQGPDIAGGLMILPKPEISWLSDMFDLKSDLFLSSQLCRHEEVTLSLVAYSHPDKFDFVYGIYRYMYNLIYINESPAAIVEHCLVRARMHDNHKLVVSLTKKLLHTFCNKFISFPEHKQMLGTLLYHGYISSYYVDKELMVHLAKLIHYAYTYLPHVGLKSSAYPNLIDNLKFAGVDITSPMNKFDILDSPYCGCICVWMDEK